MKPEPVPALLVSRIAPESPDGFEPVAREEIAEAPRIEGPTAESGGCYVLHVRAVDHVASIYLPRSHAVRLAAQLAALVG